MQRSAHGLLRDLYPLTRLRWVKASLLVIAALAAAVCSGYRVNVSRSLPLGVYRVVHQPAVPERGSIVVVCLPENWSRFALQRGILGSGRCAGGSYGLGKIVVAVEGDVVVLTRDAITINGQILVNGRTKDRDQMGRTVPHHPWRSIT